jgi:endo-1,4-beta-xylanase
MCILMMVTAYAQPPRSLVPEDPWSNFYLTGMGPENRKFVAVEGMPFARGVQLRTPAKAATNPWDISIVYQPDARVKRGETLLATFWIRAVEPLVDGRAYTRFVVQRASPPYTKSAEWHLSAGREWRRVDVPFTMVEDSEPRAWALQFWASSGAQVLEIGGLSVYNYGLEFPFRDLQLSGYPYEGSATGAAWRAEAERRIERNRKSDIVVIVRDDAGNPIPGASVRVNLKKHDFGFGTAVAYGPLKSSTSDGNLYREALSQWFNKTVLENELKWPEWESKRNVAIESLDILAGLKIGPVRGHTLVWPGLQYLPGDIPSLLTKPEQLRARVADRVTSGAAGIQGRVSEWDVVNEAVTNRDLQRVLGDSEVARWFRLANAADPKAKLYINDYSIVTSGGDDLPQQSSYYDLIGSLIKQGAPVGGIGIQAHFDQQLTPPARILEILDRFSRLGKELQITEFDVDVNDEELQAAYTRDFLTAAFSHPAVRGVLAWGFWEGSHYKPNAAMIRRDWRWKPSGEAWRELIFKKWWTDARGTSGKDGIFRTRGFRGDYEVSVTIDGSVQTISTNLSGSGPQYVRIGKTRQASVRPDGVVNAASLIAGPVAPGQMISVLGSGIGPDEDAAASDMEQQGELPSLLADTQVLVDGNPAPLLAAGEGRVSAILPYGLGVSTEIEVDFQGERSNRVWLPVAETQPGMFTTGADGKGQGVALNYASDGSSRPNSAEDPAPVGSVVGLLVTGEGRLRGSEPVHSISVRFGAVEGRVLSARVQRPGVLEVRAEIPLRAPTGAAVPVQVGVSGVWTQQGVTLAIR